MDVLQLLASKAKELSDEGEDSESSDELSDVSEEEDLLSGFEAPVLPCRDRKSSMFTVAMLNKSFKSQHEATLDEGRDSNALIELLPPVLPERASRDKKHSWRASRILPPNIVPIPKPIKREPDRPDPPRRDRGLTAPPQVNRSTKVSFTTSAPTPAQGALRQASPTSSKEGMKSHPQSPRKPVGPKMDGSQRKEWYYIDKQGLQQGPFSLPTMHRWWDAGHLPIDLKVRQGPTGSFVPISSISTFKTRQRKRDGSSITGKTPNQSAASPRKVAGPHKVSGRGGGPHHRSRDGPMLIGNIPSSAPAHGGRKKPNQHYQDDGPGDIYSELPLFTSSSPRRHAKASPSPSPRRHAKASGHADYVSEYAELPPLSGIVSSSSPGSTDSPSRFQSSKSGFEGDIYASMSGGSSIGVSGTSGGDIYSALPNFDRDRKSKNKEEKRSRKEREKEEKKAKKERGKAKSSSKHSSSAQSDNSSPFPGIRLRSAAEDTHDHVAPSMGAIARDGALLRVFDSFLKSSHNPTPISPMVLDFLFAAHRFSAGVDSMDGSLGADAHMSMWEGLYSQYCLPEDGPTSLTAALLAQKKQVMASGVPSFEMAIDFLVQNFEKAHYTSFLSSPYRTQLPKQEKMVESTLSPSAVQAFKERARRAYEEQEEEEAATPMRRNKILEPTLSEQEKEAYKARARRAYEEENAPKASSTPPTRRPPLPQSRSAPIRGGRGMSRSQMRRGVRGRGVRGISRSRGRGQWARGRGGRLRGVPLSNSSGALPSLPHRDRESMMISLKDIKSANEGYEENPKSARSRLASNSSQSYVRPQSACKRTQTAGPRRLRHPNQTHGSSTPISSDKTFAAVISAMQQRQLDEIGPLKGMSASEGHSYVSMRGSKLKEMRKAVEKQAKSDISGSPSPMASSEKRGKVLAEIMETEYTYVVSLSVLDRIYYRPLESSKMLTKQSLRVLFSDFEMILNLNKQFLQNLRERMDDSSKDTIGDLFQEFSPLIRMYTNYVRNYSRALDLVIQLRKTNKAFNSFLEERVEMSLNLPLEAFLILPVQRLPRYPMLLKELLKYTPSTHPDNDLLQSALSKITSQVEYVDAKKHEADLAKKAKSVKSVQRSRPLQSVYGMSPTQTTYTQHTMIVSVFEGRNLPKHGRVCVGIGVGQGGKDVVMTEKKKAEGKRKECKWEEENEFSFDVDMDETVVIAVIRNNGNVIAKSMSTVSELEDMYSSGEKKWMELVAVKSGKKGMSNPLVLISLLISARKFVNAEANFHGGKRSTRGAKGSFEGFNTTATTSYKAAREGELSFTTGTSIDVLEHNPKEKMYFGRIGRETGWFPMRCVKKPKG